MANPNSSITLRTSEVDLLNTYIKEKFEADNNVDLDDPNYSGERPTFITTFGNRIYFYTIGGNDDYNNFWYDYNMNTYEHEGNLCLSIHCYRYDDYYHEFVLDSNFNIIDYLLRVYSSDIK